MLGKILSSTKPEGMASPLSFEELQSLANTLAAGFESLQVQIQEQQEVEHKLRTRLGSAAWKEKSEDLAFSTQPSSTEFSDWRAEIVRQTHPHSIKGDTLQAQGISNEKVQSARTALGRLRGDDMPMRVEASRCPVAHKVPDQEDFEHDFTTQGKPGDLGCPFAKIQNGLTLDGREDPIAAEFHADQVSTQSPEVGSRCPIRFLDKHSPEEVAQYFENHKHEIPRSHQICVKRYQQNEQSIRHLDAKYGSLVNMIQGLGSKHKQYLPANELAAAEQEGSSNKAVEKWAENVSDASDDAVEENERIPRFDKELRDIRVGESPSRPWGIPVPIPKSPAASVSQPAHRIQRPLEPDEVAPGTAKAEVNPTTQPAPDPKTDQRQLRSSGIASPQIVFNGPVFFGYSAEQAALFLQNLNIGGL